MTSELLTLSAEMRMPASATRSEKRVAERIGCRRWRPQYPYQRNDSSHVASCRSVQRWMRIPPRRRFDNNAVRSLGRTSESWNGAVPELHWVTTNGEVDGPLLAANNTFEVHCRRL
jgi:hypothetical protein